jgi:hypothetical protein
MTPCGVVVIVSIIILLCLRKHPLPNSNTYWLERPVFFFRADKLRKIFYVSASKVCYQSRFGLPLTFKLHIYNSVLFCTTHVVHSPLLA